MHLKRYGDLIPPAEFHIHHPKSTSRNSYPTSKHSKKPCVLNARVHTSLLYKWNLGTGAPGKLPSSMAESPPPFRPASALRNVAQTARDQDRGFLSRPGAFPEASQRRLGCLTCLKTLPRASQSFLRRPKRFPRPDFGSFLEQKIDQIGIKTGSKIDLNFERRFCKNRAPAAAGRKQKSTKNL